MLEPVRMGKGVVQADLTYRANVDAGFIVHYQGPEDFLAVVLYHDGSSLVYVNLYQFKDGASGNLLDWEGGSGGESPRSSAAAPWRAPSVHARLLFG